MHPESLRVIARFNDRRCKGLPLYGEDLITSLTVVNSARPARTRFGGMGYVNCLNAIQRGGGGGGDGSGIGDSRNRRQTGRLWADLLFFMGI